MHFQKSFNIKNQNQLRNSDVRKLREDLKTCFPSATNDMIQSVLTGTIYCPSHETLDDETAKKKSFPTITRFKVSTHGDEIVFIYKIHNPILFRFGETGDLFPTVYTLWNVPQLIPSVGVGKPVLPHLLNGADLMIPGVSLASLADVSFPKNAIGAARIHTTIHPVALGRMALSSTELREARHQDTKGKALFVYHMFGDELWAFGDRSSPPSECSTSESTATIEEDTTVLEENEDESEKIQSTDLDNPSTSISTPEEMDNLLEETLLTAIQLKLSKESSPSFPISSSVFYDTYMIPCRPAGTLLDIRKSSFKKLGKFLKAFEKKGYLSVKEKQGETFVVSVNQSHPVLQGFIPPRHLAGEIKSSSTTRERSGSISSKAQDLGALELTYLYRPQNSSRLLDLLKTVVGETTPVSNVLYSASQLKTLVNRYIQHKKLVSRTAKNLIVLDELLSDIVLKKQESLPSLHREEVSTRILSACALHYQLSIPSSRKQRFMFSDETISRVHEFLYDEGNENKDPSLDARKASENIIISGKGQLKPITMNIRKRSGGKLVTLISGVEGFGMDPQILKEELKILCATSVSIAPLATAPASSGLQEITVQGNKVFDVIGFLARNYGVPAPAVNAPKNEKKNKWNISTPFYHVVS